MKSFEKSQRILFGTGYTVSSAKSTLRGFKNELFGDRSTHNNAGLVLSTSPKPLSLTQDSNHRRFTPPGAGTIESLQGVVAEAESSAEFGPGVNQFLMQHAALPHATRTIIAYLRDTLEPSIKIRFKLKKDRDFDETLLWVFLVGRDESLLDELDHIITDFWIHLPSPVRSRMGIDVQLLDVN